MRHLGHRVKKVGASWWYQVLRGVYISFPFHRVINPTHSEIGQVLGPDGLIARYPCKPSAGRASYRLVCTAPYTFSNLHGKSRNQVRRGLEACVVRPVSFKELQDHAGRLDRETKERQGRKVSNHDAQYQRDYCLYAAKCEGAEAWGAFVGSQLGAYLIAHRMDYSANILIVRSSRELLAQYPNNALVYQYVSTVLAQPPIKEISFGLESLQENLDSLDHFKERMGFRREVIGQRLEIAPWLKGIVQRGIVRNCLLTIARSRSVEHHSKLSGFLQWYDQQSQGQSH